VADALTPLQQHVLATRTETKKLQQFGKDCFESFDDKKPIKNAFKNTPPGLGPGIMTRKVTHLRNYLFIQAAGRGGRGTGTRGHALASDSTGASLGCQESTSRLQGRAAHGVACVSREINQRARRSELSARCACVCRGRGRVPIAGWSLGRVGPDRGLRGGGRRGWCEEWVRRG
jgi:hypothetical protein